MLLYTGVIVGSFLLCVILSSVLHKVCARSGALVFKGVSVAGGISIWAGFGAASWAGMHALGVVSPEATVIVATSLVMLLFGIIDDYKELSVTVQFLMQIATVGLLMYFGVRTRIVYLGPFLNALVTLVWVVGIANAFNHLDISDGVAAVTGILAGAAFLVISLLNRDMTNVVLSLALCGALLGFLVFNLPPARMYMGNSGSHFLGFLFSAIAIAISYAPMERKVALLSPGLILGLPILDTAFLIVARIKRKMVPFQKSNDHIILRLQVLGYSKKKILCIMGLWGLLFAITGVAVSQFPNHWGALAAGCAGIVSFKVIKAISGVAVHG